MDCTTCHSLLVEYVYDELDPGRRAEVEEALTRCPDCRAEVDQLVATRAAFDGLEPIELSALRRADILRASRLAVDRPTASPWWAALLSPASAMAATLFVAAGVSYLIVRGPGTAPLEQQESVAAAEVESEDEHLAPSPDPSLIPEAPVPQARTDVPHIAEQLRAQAAELAELPSQGAGWPADAEPTPAPPERSGYLEAESVTNALPAPTVAAPTTTAAFGRTGGGEMPAVDGSISAAEPLLADEIAAAPSGDGYGAINELQNQQAARTTETRSANTGTGSAAIGGLATGGSAASGASRSDDQRQRGGATTDTVRAADAPTEVAAAQPAARPSRSEASAEFEPTRPEASAPVPPAEETVVVTTEEPAEETDALVTREAARAVAANEDRGALVEQPAFDDDADAVAAPAAGDDYALGLAAYDRGDYAEAARRLHAWSPARGRGDAGTALYYEAASLAAMGDSSAATALLERFDRDFGDHLLAGEARRLLATLRDRRPDAANRRMDLDQLAPALDP